MSMTNRGATYKAGSKAVISPFMDNGVFTRISITVDNSYNRGRIPAFSLWAPSDYSSNPWKYMPYIPPIPITATNSSSYYDIPNLWSDYFRGGDEVIALDYSQITASTMNMKFFGKQACADDTDITTATLGTTSATVASVGVKDSGGTGYTRVTMTDMLDTDTGVATGALGTGDILVLAGSSTSTAISAYQQAKRIVIVEQEFDFADAITGTKGEGGYLLESVIYSYTGRIDKNYLCGGPYAVNVLNTDDSSPALTSCTKFVNGMRFNFESVYRG